MDDIKTLHSTGQFFGHMPRLGLDLEFSSTDSSWNVSHRQICHSTDPPGRPRTMWLYQAGYDIDTQLAATKDDILAQDKTEWTAVAMASGLRV